MARHQCTFAVLVLLMSLQIVPAAASNYNSVMYGLEIASVDLSWRVCRAGFQDPHFSSVCPASSTNNPLHVAVTVSATWWAAPGSLGPQGAGQWASDTSHVLLPIEAGSYLARKIGWRADGDGAWTVIPGDSDTQAYAFAVTNATKLSTHGPHHSSLFHVNSRFSFMIELPREGYYDVEFTGCCRWTELANIQQKDYPHRVPWHLSTRIMASVDSFLAPPFSPRLSMPVTEVVLWHSELRAFRLTAAYGGELVSMLDDQDISGRYLEVPVKMSLDSTAYVTTQTQYAAFVREDKNKSIVWFESPEEGRNQFSSSGAHASPALCRAMLLRAFMTRAAPKSAPQPH